MENERLRHKLQCLESSAVDLPQQLNQLQMENAQLQRKIKDLKSQKSDEPGMVPEAITRHQTKNKITEQEIQIKQVKVRKYIYSRL